MDLLYINISNNYFNKLSDTIDIVNQYNNTDWKQYVVFSDINYNRIKLTKYSNDMFEFILICWSPSQESPIHNHPTNGCIMKVLDGCLEETLYDHNINIKSINIYNINETSYMDNMKGLHKIKSKGYSVSLHIYSPPNYKSNVLIL